MVWRNLDNALKEVGQLGLQWDTTELIWDLEELSRNGRVFSFPLKVYDQTATLYFNISGQGKFSTGQRPFLKDLFKFPDPQK